MNERPKSFSELIRTSSIPVLVDFYADWCGPCKMVGPVVAQIAGELKGRILTVKINIDKKPALATQWQISSVPTIMLFSAGQSVMRLSGAYPYESLKAEILKHL
ncbi:thioredoxin [Sediminispirochaeta bajacaliforniensis]|uniref:thioredoxin n=1 Tax=Sediminispirochaeta bajacaliforniensis TaxID=148 RepID=UPI00037CE679|nr:thioredoxin [Sediminispirochaeta bajacaliforniensis]